MCFAAANQNLPRVVKEVHATVHHLPQRYLRILLHIFLRIYLRIPPSNFWILKTYKKRMKQKQQGSRFTKQDLLNSIVMLVFSFDHDKYENEKVEALSFNHGTPRFRALGSHVIRWIYPI